MNVCYIPVSLGELYDKYTILRIKKDNINDPHKLLYIDTELKYLLPFIDKYPIDYLLINELKDINEILWNVEDKIRLKESKQEFDDEFILLARQVYITNDMRNKIKNKISSILNSELYDIKSYVKY